MTCVRLRRAFRSSAALGLIAALLLTGCERTPDPDEGADMTENAHALPPRWSEWIELDYRAEPKAVRGGFMVIHDRDADALRVLNNLGSTEWELPAITRFEGEALVLYDAERVYVQLDEPERPVAALDWETGEELWRFSPGEASDCAPGAGWTLSSPQAGTVEVPEGASLLVQRFDTADPACHTGPNATFPEYPALFALDPETGVPRWEPVAGYGQDIPAWTAPDLSGEHVDRTVGNRGLYRLTRTDLGTGESRHAPLNGLEPTSRVESVHDLGADRFLVMLGDGEPLVATVEEWSADVAQGGRTTLEPANSDQACVRRTLRSSSGRLFCVGPSEDSATGDPAFTVALLQDAEPDDSLIGDPAYISTAAPANATEGFRHVDQAYLSGDPLIPPNTHDGTPWLALPGADAGVRAVDLLSGEVHWSWEEGEEPGVSATFVEEIRELLFVQDDQVISVNPYRGSELWREEGRGLHSHGAAISVEDPDGEGSRLRIAIPSRPI